MDGSRNQSARLGGGTTCIRVSTKDNQNTNESKTGIHERHGLLTRQGADYHGHHHCSQVLSYPIRHCWAPSSDELGQEPKIAGTVFFLRKRQALPLSKSFALLRRQAQRSEGGGSTEQIFHHVRKMPSSWSDDWSADSSLSSNSTPVCPQDSSDPDATERSSPGNASVLTKVCSGVLPASDDRCRTKCLKKVSGLTAGGGSACDVGTINRARCALLLARTAQGC